MTSKRGGKNRQECQICSMCVESGVTWNGNEPGRKREHIVTCEEDKGPSMFEIVRLCVFWCACTYACVHVYVCMCVCAYSCNLCFYTWEGKRYSGNVIRRKDIYILRGNNSITRWREKCDLITSLRCMVGYDGRRRGTEGKSGTSLRRSSRE